MNDPTTVSDSTPLILLAKIGKLGVLRNLFKKIYIPEAVFNETRARLMFTFIPLLKQVGFRSFEVKLADGNCERPTATIVRILPGFF